MDHFSTSCSLHSRNGFNWFSYFVFFYNAIVGFVGAIIRVLLSLAYGTLLLFRLDQNIMMEGFQFADRGIWSSEQRINQCITCSFYSPLPHIGGVIINCVGNKIYRCFLYLEHTYNNPVANAFVALLLDRDEQGLEKGVLSFGQGNYCSQVSSTYIYINVYRLKYLLWLWYW